MVKSANAHSLRRARTPSNSKPRVRPFGKKLSAFQKNSPGHRRIVSALRVSPRKEAPCPQAGLTRHAARVSLHQSGMKLAIRLRPGGALALVGLPGESPIPAPRRRTAAEGLDERRERMRKPHGLGHFTSRGAIPAPRS